MRNAGVPPLHLRVGDLVEVRSEQEILATLDAHGAVDGMPFMPEMLEYCGKRFRVEKRADKTCNTITATETRRLYDAVHLEGLRCNGDAHGGCQAQCFLFWKEAWLKRVGSREAASERSSTASESATSSILCDRARLNELTQTHDASNQSEIHYRCQATDLLKASAPLLWWDIRQYVRDVRSGNVGVLDVIRAALFRIFQMTLRITAYNAQIRMYNRFQSWRGGAPYPYDHGKLDKTPRQRLNIQPGEMVQIKSYEEILETLNKKNKNQGLSFDAEMVPYCGTVRRVVARVERTIDDRTGKMLLISSDCLMLEGTVCRSKYGAKRLFCPRTACAYWREIWVKRIGDPPDSPAEFDTSVSDTNSASSIDLPHSR